MSIMPFAATKKTLDIDDFHRMVQRLGEPEPAPTTFKFMSAAKALGMSTRESTKLTALSNRKASVPVAVVPPLSSPPREQCTTPANKEPVQVS